MSFACLMPRAAGRVPPPGTKRTLLGKGI